jgi:NAD-dependent deacetylase
MDDFVKLIEKSHNIVALTGAGLSTAAGIPDFRGPQGLYITRRYDLEKTFEIRWFKREPQYFYSFAVDFADLLSRISPTFAHIFLARLETSGKLSAVVTQNIDMLHQAAGSRNVIELHGSIASATCMECGKNFMPLNVNWWQRAIAESSCPPVVLCLECHGVLKPDIVFYGEMVHRFEEAQAAVINCDLLLVLGTSLTVYPAASLPGLTDAPVVVVSQGEVSLSPTKHHHVVRADLDEFCRSVANHLSR